MFGNDLRDKLVLITGASTGIGAAAAKAFADVGAHVAVHYNASADAARQVQQAIAAGGGTCVLVQGDLTVAGKPARIVTEAASLLGGLDILVNNAGSLVRREPFANVGEDLINSVFGLNVLSVIAACQTAIA